jgi:4-amino-4-deoxy-L-arabinose transferase-like glycosyltransferase
MHFTHPAYSRDTPELVNTAFTLGISHPAGFPIYNLMAKAMTFFPMGSIPFKVNLFASFMGCLALLALYMTSVTFLKVMAGSEQSDSYSWCALIPVGFLTFSIPFWGNTMLAEVYTLHTLFTVLVILGLLKWKEKSDIRYLYSAALIYGLSAGNHGTVAFYLPAILVLFFFWCRQDRWKHLSLCALFFLWGFSVYMYLPIRSLTEPTFDWGNPETLQGFLFQITDQKDSDSHFAAANQPPPS